MTVWTACYDDSWRDLIVPAAFAHPAKMARGLLERIITHLYDLGAVERGSLVLDPFGGIGTTAIIGASHGLRVVCCELEPKFVELARQNITMHRRGWESMGLPIPIVIQGDSRYLRTALMYADAIVSSPPFTQGYSGGGGINLHGYGPDGADKVGSRTYQGTGAEREPGNLETLSLGTVEAVISSPPYSVIATGAGGLNTKEPKLAGQQGGRSASSASQDTDQRYGQTEGQLARLPTGTIDDAGCQQTPTGGEHSSRRGVSSQVGSTSERTARALRDAAPITASHSGPLSGPPSNYPEGDEALEDSELFEGSERVGTLVELQGWTPRSQLSEADQEDGVRVVSDEEEFGDSPQERRPLRQPAREFGSAVQPVPYAADEAEVVGGEEGGAGSAEGQRAGGVAVETFWVAAHQVVRECYAILRPGGYAVWVVKAFVRNKKLVDFPGDWRRLCEHAGFITIEEIHASLVQETTHAGLFGEMTTKKERKSFFRRLAEKKGSPRIDYEVVWVMRKPA